MFANYTNWYIFCIFMRFSIDYRLFAMTSGLFTHYHDKLFLRQHNKRAFGRIWHRSNVFVIKSSHITISQLGVTISRLVVTTSRHFALHWVISTRLVAIGRLVAAINQRVVTITAKTLLKLVLYEAFNWSTCCLNKSTCCVNKSTCCVNKSTC